MTSSSGAKLGMAIFANLIALWELSGNINWSTGQAETLLKQSVFPGENR